MSLLSKLAKGAAAVLKSPVAKFVPGLNIVSGALTVGAVGKGIYDMARARSASPTPPFIPSPSQSLGPALSPIQNPQANNDWVRENLWDQSPFPHGSKEDVQWVTQTAAQVRAGTYVPAGSANVVDARNFQMGAAPSWGNLGRRAVAVAPAVGRAIVKSRWVKNVVGGVATWFLIDAVGNILKQSAHAPRRTMNPFNPRALARADRRVKAFSDRARPVLRELGYQVSATRKVKGGGKKRRRRCA